MSFAFKRGEECSYAILLGQGVKITGTDVWSWVGLFYRNLPTFIQRAPFS